ncbi:protein LURP-one-related 15-like [Rutidosis leptorrhynchoides]|uniref:protein LURP-one-related 15-like n=1 Tax=Rutidosis leptorrhynchoides TaxID=125765 RepID=UPI003A9A4B68
MANSSSVVCSHEFVAPYQVDLTMVEKLSSITDVNGNILFKVKSKRLSLRDRRVLADHAGNPVLSFHRKFLSVHDRWIAFRGDSSDSKNKIFSVKQSSFIQFKTSLDVFMGYNGNEHVCDFKVIKGSWFGNSCTIYAGNGTTIIAKMSKKHIQ